MEGNYARWGSIAMIVNVDLHTHSRFSFDGVMSPNQIVRIARRNGLSAIAVTDHNTVAGGMRAAQENKLPDLLVIVGAEISTEVGDILGLFLHEEIRSRKSNEVIAEIRGQGGFVILPHPYQHHSSLTEELLTRFHAVELHNGRVAHDYARRARVDFAERYGLAELGNSDAHLFWEIGRARTRLEIDRLNEESIRFALANRHCHALKELPGRSNAAVYISKIIKHLRSVPVSVVSRVKGPEDCE